MDDAHSQQGLLTTASDLLFTGTRGDPGSDPIDARRVDGYLCAFDAEPCTRWR